EDGRVELDGTEQGDDLGLAAGEIAARFVQERSVSPQDLEQSQDPFPVEVFPLVDLEREGTPQVVRDAPPEERRPLMEIDHFFSIARDRFLIDGRTLVADEALVERVQEGDGSQEHRLP